MSLTITPSAKIFEIDTKRFYVPFVVSSPCPQCEELDVQDLSRHHYFAYPIVGEPIPFGFYCSECDTEWSHRVVLGITLTQVSESDHTNLND